MNIEYNYFKTKDGLSLAYKSWDKVEKPIGVIIIIHGMAEHIERYDDFAAFLNSKNYIVYGADHRGHGKTSGKRGFFGHKKGWSKLIEDQVELYYFIKNKNKDLTISYVSHSMGSFIMRNILSMKDLDIEKAIISGTGYKPYFVSKVNLLLAKIITKFHGKAKPAYILDRLVNGTFERSVKKPNTQFDWLSRDSDQVAKYISDEECGFICTNQFYCDLFKHVSLASHKPNINKINKELPLLLYSGDNDPVGGKNASDVKKLYNIYKNNGLNASLHINPEGRHENLNETNKEEVYNTFYAFLK